MCQLTPGQNEKRAIWIPSKSHTNVARRLAISPGPVVHPRAHTTIQPGLYFADALLPIYLSLPMRPWNRCGIGESVMVDQHSHASI